MPLTELKSRSAQKASVIALMLVVLSLLQFCFISVTRAAIERPCVTLDENVPGHSKVEQQIISHDCLLQKHTFTTQLKPLCHHCDSEFKAIQISQLSLNPVFALQYLAFSNLNLDSYSPVAWQRNTEPWITITFPDIYLAKQSFLE
ncbi:hypothetical protein [Endozoicomonas sp. Mp262]|uniref:hypothetical protein n=1 Tax=Endozoicomonas sp. Mp262 TaxID=2919499 RepID=UPI0021DF8AE8